MAEAEKKGWMDRAWDTIGAGAFGSAPVQPGQPAPAGPALAAPPPQAGPQAAPSPQQAPGGAQGALSGPQALEDPAAKEQAVKVAQESAAAVETATPEDKAAINKELEGIVGGPDKLEEAYNEMIEKLGGLKTYDPKMKREDWGLFMMDFGMRMMAASGSWNAQLGGAIGEAGSGALAGLQARQQGERAYVDQHNQGVREGALELASMRSDPDALVWTDKGAYNTTTGQYEKGPDGGALQPGQEPGASNKQYARNVSEEALRGAGLPSEVAARIAHSGAPDPAELEFEFGKQFDKMQEGAGLIAKIPGTDKKWKDATFEDRQRWIDQRVKSIYGNMEAQAGGALTAPGPAAEGRRPSTWDKY